MFSFRWRLAAAMAALGGLALAMPQSAPTQAMQEPAPATGVEVTLHDNQVRWHTAPGTVVRAELRNGTTVKSTGPQRLADENGLVVLPLAGGGGPGGGGGGGGGGGNQANAFVRPGDRIVLTPDGGTAVAFDVPVMNVALDAAADRLVGNAPAGASLEIAAELGGPTATGTATAGPDGSFEWASAGVDAGETATVVLRMADQNVVTAWAAAVRANVSFGSSQISGAATPGGTITIGYHHLAGDASGQNTTNVNGGTDWNVNTGMGGGGPGGGGMGGGRVPFSVGDTVTVTYGSGLPAASFTSVGVLPNVTINDGGGGFVGGQANPGARVEVQALGPNGESFTAMTTADASGQWVADLSAAVGLGAGWRLRAAAEAAPGLFVTAVDAIEQVRVGVHRDLVTGVADPGTPISVTLRGPDGTEKDSDTTRSNNQGTFNASVGPMAVGDLLEVYFVAGDPVVITIPELTAVADAARDVVSGVGPAGATVTIAQGQGQGAVEQSAAIAEDGRWSVSLAGTRDIEPPMNGSVTVRLSGGHELFTSWAAVRLTTEVGDTFLSGNGPAGRDVVAELVAAGGTVVARGADSVPAGGGGGGGGGGGFGGGGGNANGGNWLLRFADDTGTEVRVRAGDTIRATVGDESIALLVPTLKGVAFVADDTINGQTTSGSDVVVRVTRPLVVDATVTITATVDPAGTFSHTFPDEGEGAYDLQHNDAILLQTRVGTHNVNSQLFVPGLRLELDQAVLVGSWTPDIEVDVAVVGAGGGTKATARTTAGDDAVFNAILTNAAGERIEPQAGDRVMVLPFGDLSAEPLELVVPELTLNANVISNTLSGRATPGGILQVNVRDAIDVNPQPGFGPQVGTQPTIGADGAWSAGPFGGGGPGGGGPGGGGPGGGGGYDVRAGTRMQAVYRVPSGHIVARTRYVPMVSVQHGGSAVCGFSDPRSPVSAALKAADGAAVANASGNAGFNSFFALGLAKDGEPVLTAAGQHIEAQLGTTAVSLTLPTISVTVDWAADRVTGTGPASTAGQLFQPARDCLDTQPRQSQPFQVNAEGAFTINNIQGPPRAPGAGIEIAFITAEGHRIYRHAFRSLAQIFVGTDRVAGRATEGTAAVITVNGPGGTARGTTTAKAGAGGFFDTRVPAAAGGALVIGEGDIVHLEASGESVDVTVEPLAFDWSPNSAIVGTAQPNRALTLSLRLRDGRVLSVERTTDAGGSIRYGAQDVPPRADWSLADIVGVRLIAVTSNGHQLISEAGDFADVPVTPPTPRDDLTVYMPYATNKR